MGGGVLNDPEGLGRHPLLHHGGDVDHRIVTNERTSFRLPSSPFLKISRNQLRDSTI
jgi:hypothetical protein